MAQRRSLLVLTLAAFLSCTSKGSRDPFEEEDERKLPQDPITQVDHDRDGTTQQSGATLVINALAHDTSKPLVEMARDLSNVRQEKHIASDSLGRIPHTPEFYAPKTDEALQAPEVKALSNEMPAAPLSSFEGIGEGFVGPAGTFSDNVAPPDPSGDVGPNHYVQVVNTALAVFRKNGTPLLGAVPTQTLWSGFNSKCAETNDGDGIVRYDRIADRWVVAQFSVTGPEFYECIAVSTTPDPTGTWHRYAFAYDKFNDYPKMGLWPDGYYFTYNLFSGNSFAGARTCAMDRTKMLAGAAATQVCFTTTTAWGSLMPADLDGPSMPPAGAPNLVVALGNNNLGFWKFHVNFANPNSSTFTGPVTVPVAAFTPLCGDAFTCITQPGQTNKLDSLSDRLMNRFAYRNFGSHESLVVSHAVTAGSGGGMRWYEIRNPGAATPTIFQQGTYAPDSAFRWMGSVAMDKAGDIALGYAISSSTIKPSIRYAARIPGDPAGSMPQAEGTLVTGTGVQTGNLNRYGDYSSLNIDPTDDCTFWYTQEYLAADGSFNWHSRIGSFKLNNCGGTGDTVAPTTAITAPTAGSTVKNTVSITATATDNVGVTKVEFYVDGTLLSTSTTSPYSASWNTTTATNGNHTLGTKAYDAANNVGTSAAVTVTVSNTTSDTTPPTVSLTSPTAGSTVSGMVTLSANATDNVGVTQVQFFVDGNAAGVDTTSPYSVTLDSTSLSNGSHTLTAKALDAAANVGSSAAVSVTVSNNNSNALQNGVPVGPLADVVNGQKVFTLQVPAGATNLRFGISGGTGDADLYVKFGSAPTKSSYDCRPYLAGNNEFCNISTVEGGTYYVMIDAFAAYTGVSVVGSFSTSNVVALQNNVPVSNLSGSVGDNKLFSLTVPASASSVTFNISGGSGDADLYVKFGAVPTTTTFDCRPYLSGNTETCTFMAQPGTYYVMLRAFRSYSGVTLTGKY